MTPRPWRQAWHEALYARDGFYRSPEGPGGHFTTSAQGIPGVSDVLAQAVAQIALHHEVDVVVDFACGRGEFAETLLEFANPDTEVVAVDVVERPRGLDERITWLRSPGGERVPNLEILRERRVLIFAHEWLDVVPCTIAQADMSGQMREVLVEADGAESLGDPLEARDAAWLTRYGGPHEDGSHPGSTGFIPDTRIEIGASRDSAWLALIEETRRCAAPGSIIMGVDYAITRDSASPYGTLTGFREGSECAPIPDGSCDLTSHVRIDSLTLTVTPHTQREVLTELFGQEPLQAVPVELATTHPHEYLQRLSARSAFAAASSPGGLGDFRWFSYQI